MPEPLKIYLSCKFRDSAIARRIYFELKKAGFSPWMDDEDILPGDNVLKESKLAMKNSSVLLFLLSNDPDHNLRVEQEGSIKLFGVFDKDRYRYVLNEYEKFTFNIFKSRQQTQKTLIIPIIVDKLSSKPYQFSDIQHLILYENFEQGVERLIESLQRFSNQVKANSVIAVNQNSGTLQNLLISKVELINIRCFEEFSISLEEDGKPIQWGMILGDNAAGKTTLLRSIALGLCDQGDAAALMRSLSGGFVRQGCDEGYIKIQLRNVATSSEPMSMSQRLHRALLSAFPTISKLSALKSDLQTDFDQFSDDTSLSEQVDELITWAEVDEEFEKLIETAQKHNPDNLSLQSLNLAEENHTYTITTKITKQSEDSEIVTQEIEPTRDFLWSDVFVCGYGANRTTQTYSNHEGYRSLDAVQSLFTAQANFQDPELILRRRNPEVRKQLERLLLDVLMLEEYEIVYSDRGIEVNGPWGRQPLSALSDGYRSTSQWLLDFMGWAIHANRLTNSTDIGGILLIDEIEQHLHPRWQRYIVQRLHKMFPTTQIIASTHTPLAAAGIADLESGILIKLERNEDGFIEALAIDKEFLNGKRADQILTSAAFGLLTSRNLGSQDEVDRYSELLGLTHRTEAEEEELERSRVHIQTTQQDGETETERLVKQEVGKALQNLAQDITPELLDLEINKHLQQLTRAES